MTLRRPAAYLPRPSSWRRSGDETYWESFKSDKEPHVARPSRATRPQSAIEGGQLDGWLEQLQRMQKDLFRTPGQDRGQPALNKEQGVRRQQGIPSFSRGSSSCGSPSLYNSSLGSQESLQTGFLSPPERRGSLERARIIPAPRKEQAQLSNLTPVKTGWLPVQRKVMMVADHNQTTSDPSPGQVRLKQPITPTFQKSQAATNQHQDGEVERSHVSPSALGARMRQTPDQASPIIKQVPAKQRPTTNEVDKPVRWQSLRRDWNSNRLSSPPGCRSNELPSGSSSDPYFKSPLVRTTSVEPHRPAGPLHHATSAEPCRPHAVQRRINGTESVQSHTPSPRTRGGQPVAPAAPLCRTSSLQPSNIHTSSVPTTLVPQNKIGFSSITISSRKVSRSASLSSSDSVPRYRSRETASLPLAHEPMEPNSSEVTVQRRATIVKVTEQRTAPSPVLSRKGAEAPPTSHSVDTVVHRRKATIIKVTEHRESYGPANGKRNPAYRHSYTEGVFKESSMWNQRNHAKHSTAPSYHHVESTETSDPVKNGAALHTSTLRLFVSNPPAIAPPTPPEIPPKAVDRGWNRPCRPQSYYGDVFAPSKSSREEVTQPAVRKLSFGLPQEAKTNPVSSCGRPARPGTEEAVQFAADTSKPSGDGTDRQRGDAATPSPPSLTLIEAPDPHSHQSPEEVLALNAAAIIANIKLQRQLSLKRTPNGNHEKDSVTPPQGNTDERKCVKSRPSQRVNEKPHAAFVPLTLDPEGAGERISLQEALQRSRPHFIARSQGRVQKLERRARERRELAKSRNLYPSAAPRQRRTHRGGSTSVKGNISKPTETAIKGNELQLRWKWTPADVKKKKEEEKKQEAPLSNRQRVELFKKKLLDQILHRGNN